MTQHELAAASGINQTMISRWETGRVEPRRSSISALAAALGCDAAWLAGSGEQSVAAKPTPSPSVDSGMGLRIQEARRRAGMTQSDLASATGINQTMISRWENGHVEPRQASLKAMADALRCDLGWLATGYLQESFRDDGYVEPPGLTEFLKTPFGQSVPSTGVSALRSLRAAEGTKIHEWPASQWGAIWASIAAQFTPE